MAVEKFKMKQNFIWCTMKRFSETGNILNQKRIITQITRMKDVIEVVKEKIRNDPWRK